MEGGLRITTEITMSEYLNLLKYKEAYLNITEGLRIPRDYTIEKEAIDNMNMEKYRLKVLERIEYR